MDKKSAEKLVQETLQSSFDKERFVYLVKNIVNHFEEDHKRPYTGSYIFADYRDSIQSLDRIGKYKGPDDKLIDILIVYLSKETSLERARTKQRNFVAKYLKGSRGGVLKDAALVAFVAPNGADWRFSLVKMEYKLRSCVKNHAGSKYKFNEKGKVEEEFTPARRYSFLVGQNENSHTAQSRLLPILSNDEVPPTLEELEEVFSVERVTKEFFEKYRDLFLRLKEALDEVVKKDAKVKADFKEKNIDTADFAKKLLGQIVFLYFLQKKGWFGVPRGKEWGEGDKQFLRNLFVRAQKENKNYFNKFLEPLFYEALRLERPKDYYDQFECRIPFLNGGLFDPLNEYDWQDTDIEIRDEIFSNGIIDTKTGDKGTGVLDIFDRYNFTVKEDEPLEKEVAVDPEMLGKVFENLLKVKDRKSKGTYYTPREIVHYMCQESLANYLFSVIPAKAGIQKEAIETLIKYGETVVEHDSRVASEGRETKDYSFKLPASIRECARLIDEKLKTIRICDPAVGSGAFPVGMMNEIIRTRNALTPYLSLRGADATKQSRTPYHFKREAIQNCLYGVDIDPGAVEIAKLRLWLSLIVDEEERETIQPLPNLDYKIVQGNSLLSVEKNLFNAALFSKLEELKPLYFNETSASKKQEYRKQIDELISQITNGHKDFDFEVYFSEVFHEKKGFDVVIANPPYGANIDDMIETYAKLYPNTTKAYKDIYKLFIELGISKVLAVNGTLCYITPNTLLLQPRYKDVRQYLLQYRILEILNLGEEVFNQVVVPTSVIFIQKMDAKDNLIRFCDLSEASKFSGTLQDMNFVLIKQNDYSHTTDNIFIKDIRALQEDEITLDEICELKDCGIKYQRVNVGLSKKGGSDLAERIFYSGTKRNNKDKQFVIGKDLYKDGWHINLTPHRYIKHNYRQLLKDNEIVYFNGKVFNKREKLVWRQTSSHFVGTLLDRPIWFANTLQGGFVRDQYKQEISIKYLLALLNSKYLRYLYCLSVRESGRVFPQIKLSKLRGLPVKKISLEKQKTFDALVDKILAITKDDDYLENPAKQAQVRDHEKQIDQLVYKLYGLTPEEIKILESTI